MSNALINSASFRAALSRLGNTPATVDAMARYAVFHGAQGQFTPANNLMERLQSGGMTRGDVGRAALDMLSTGLKEFATLTGSAYKSRKGAELLSTDGAQSHALALVSIDARMQAFTDARAKAKANRTPKEKAPAVAGDDSSSDDTSENKESPAIRADGVVVIDDAIAAAVAEATAEHVEYVRIARSNSARAYALQLKAEAETLDAVRATEAARVELESVRGELAEVQARYARLVAQQTSELLTQAGVPTVKAKRSRAVALAA